MKYRPSAGFLVCVAVVLSFAGIMAWFWSRLQAFPVHQWRNLTFAEIQRGVKFDQHGRAPEQIDADRERLLGVKQKMLTEYPDLAIHWKPVPDERNGFRGIHRLAEQMEKGDLRVSYVLSEALKPDAPWDAAAMRTALVENGELVERIESIAAMPGRSLEKMPESYSGYLSSTNLNLCKDILMAKARLAAEAKDETETLRLVAASLNLASHLDQVEAPVFHIAVVAIVIDLGTREAVITRLLPAIGPEADLPRWRAVLASRPDYTPDSYSRILLGEWRNLMDSISTPYFMKILGREPAEEAETFYRILSSQYLFRVRHLRGQKTGVLLSMPMPPLPGHPISAEMRRKVEIHWEGSENWGKGYARAASARAMTLAALDLLVLGKSGNTLSADSASKVTPEPLTGQAFLYDPATRTLNVPPTIAADMNLKPVVLPW